MASHRPLSPQMLALHCERYQGDKLLRCQETLAELDRVQKRTLSLSLQLLKRHPSPDGELPGGQRALSELDGVLSELLKELDSRVSGENGTTRQTQTSRQVATKAEGVFKPNSAALVQGSTGRLRRFWAWRKSGFLHWARRPAALKRCPRLPGWTWRRPC